MPDRAVRAARNVARRVVAGARVVADAGLVFSDVDAGLAALLRRDVLDAAEIDVVFDAPTREWAAGRSAPTVNAFLYDIREDVKRRQHGEINVRDTTGQLTRRMRPPRSFRLSYLITAWTQRPEDEHRLLGAVLSCLLGQDSVPAELLADELSALGPLTMSVGLPPSDDRSFADVWSALGGALKPSLDVVITAAMAVGVPLAAAPPVRQPTVVSLREKDTPA